MKILGIDRIKAGKDEDAVTNIFSNVFDHTRLIVFKSVKSGSANISLSTEAIPEKSHILYEKRILKIGLNTIYTMKPFVNRHFPELLGENQSLQDIAANRFDNGPMRVLRNFPTTHLNEVAWARQKHV